MSILDNPITIILTLAGVLGSLITIIIKLRRKKITIKEGEKKIQLEGYNCSEVVQIIDQIQIRSNKIPQIQQPMRNQLKPKKDVD